MSSFSGAGPNFTDEQLCIINDNCNHLIVTAVAGSGKTTTIGAKAKYLIDNGTYPNEIAIITYSRALGDELRSRMPRGVNARTIDSFCYSCLPDLGDTSKRDNIKNFKKHIIDKDIVHHNFKKLSHLFVDESQDLNEERTRVVLYLISKLPGLIVTLIGDPYQQIYEGLGSSSKYMMEISDYLTIRSKRPTKQLCLSYNFRSSNVQLLDIQTKLLQMSPPIRSGLLEQYRKPANVHYVKTATLNDDAYIDYLYSLIDTLFSMNINGKDICILNPTGSIRSDKDTASKKLLTTIRSKLEEDYNNNDFYKSMDCKYIEIDTVHSMKGKEKNHVIVINVVEAKYGFQADSLNLFYVAVSRAKHSLHLVVPQLKSYKESKFLKLIKDDLDGYEEDLTIQTDDMVSLHLESTVTSYISSIPNWKQDEILDDFELRECRTINQFNISSTRFDFPQAVEEYGDTVAKRLGIRVFYGRFLEKVAVCAAFENQLGTTSLVNYIMGTLLIRQSDLIYLQGDKNIPASLIKQARALVSNRQIEGAVIIDSPSGKVMKCSVIREKLVKNGKKMKHCVHTSFKLCQHYNPSIMFSNFHQIKSTLKKLDNFIKQHDYYNIVDACYELARYEQYIDHDWILFVVKLSIDDLLPHPYKTWEELCSTYRSTLGLFEFKSAQEEIVITWMDWIKRLKPELQQLKVDPMKFHYLAASEFAGIPDVIVNDNYEVIDLKCYESEDDVYYIDNILQILFYGYMYHVFVLKQTPDTMTNHLYSLKTMKMYTYQLDFKRVEMILRKALEPAFETIKEWLQSDKKDKKFEIHKKLSLMRTSRADVGISME